MMRLVRALPFLMVASLLSATADAQTITPQGRLTLISGQPVMQSDVTGAPTVYYDCYAGNVVPVGATPTNLTISSCEISMGLAAANVLSGSIYDIFGVNNSGALTLCIGPAWTSAASRGTGAGTTQIDQTNGGVWTNTNSLTHCYGGAAGTTDYGSVAAHAAVYLGSLYATAAGQTTMQFAPPPTAGGSAPVMGLFNGYQRTLMRSLSQDATGSWTYNSATWRGADNSAMNRITWLDGLAASRVAASYAANAADAGGANFGVEVGVDFNSTTATPGGIVGELGAASSSSFNVEIAGGNAMVGLGLNYAQAVEKVRGGTGTYLCGQTVNWCGLSVELLD